MGDLPPSADGGTDDNKCKFIFLQMKDGKLPFKACTSHSSGNYKSTETFRSELSRLKARALRIQSNPNAKE